MGRMFVVLICMSGLVGEAAAESVAHEAFPGMRYSEYSVKSRAEPNSLEECREACVKVSPCRGWSWKQPKGWGCLLVTGPYAKLSSDTGWTAGAVHRRATIHIGHLTFPGKIYKTQAGQWLQDAGSLSLKQCAQRCWERSTCKSWTWDTPTSKGVCYHIVADGVPLIDNKTSTSGWINRSIQSPPFF